MNASSDHRAGRFWRRVLLTALGTALPLVAQEVTVATRDGGAATSAATPTESARSTRPPTPSAPAVNPLEGYLSDWMRPRDRALLRKDAAATPTTAESWRRLATASPSPAARKAAPKPAVPTANPYIDAMNAAALPAPATAATPAPAGSLPPGSVNLGTTSAPASLAEPEAPAPPAPTRYQPPPSSDAKYFPQLKRF